MQRREFSDLVNRKSEKGSLLVIQHPKAEKKAAANVYSG